MKKILLLLIAIAALQTAAYSQTKKPVVMVVPADGWCVRNGYTREYTVMGDTKTMPDYSAAFAQDSELRTVISAVSDFMAANSFPLQSLEAELSRINNESAEMAMMQGKSSGAAVEETPVELLRRTAKADIILNLDYTITRTGPRRQMEFNLQAIDACSSKIISGNTGTSSPVSSSTPMTTILEESVLSFKDNFLNGLQRYFDDMFANGREISVTLFRFDNCPTDFETEYTLDGEEVELAEIIDEWVAGQTVKGRFTMGAKSANRLRFTQVRIPLYGIVRGNERAVDAQSFGNELAKYLRKEPFNLMVGVTPKGLGEVWLTIGDK